ncbi:CvpA family protein [Candidatus Uhrbacteria bacterium]|nr:CvpA family protein [Candidatus Uhrbacteria bacterium]
MSPSLILDIVLLLAFGGFIATGWKFGLIQGLGSMLGAVLGALWSFSLSGGIAHAFGLGAVGRVIILLILFLLIAKLIGLLFWAINKFYKLFSFIPLSGTLNHLLGAVLGLLEGILILGVILYYALTIIPFAAVSDTITHADLGHALQRIGKWIVDVLPWI